MMSPDTTLRAAVAGAATLAEAPEQRTAAVAIHTSAPGRICLFGEHQDYLRLPVIAMAIDLRINLEGRPRAGTRFLIQMPDVDEELEFDPNLPFEPRHGRDYLPAAANVLRRQGLSWPQGYEVTISSTIPINGGASSSSARQVAWVAFLLSAAGDPRAEDADFVARMAYESEVKEFASPGGMMDHYSSALGGVIWLDCLPMISYRKLNAQLGPFLLIDSATPKNTNGILGRVRGGVEDALQQIATEPNVAPLGEAPLETLTVNDLPVGLGQAERQILSGTLIDRDLTREARALFETQAATPAAIGQLLSRHQWQLAEALGISTSTIDGILQTASEAGALGGKINGSGGGGTCFVLAGEHLERVREAVTAAGYRSWVVATGPGLRVRRTPQ